jgi:hypothetical protein
MLVASKIALAITADRGRIAASPAAEECPAD